MAILGKVYGLNCKVSDRSVNHEYTLASYDIEQLATVEVSVTLIDAESGEAITLKELGSGQDSFDKSVAKAQTIAIKYCSLNSLAIATYDNPEADRHTDEVMQPKPAPKKITLQAILLATTAIVPFLKRLLITLNLNDIHIGRRLRLRRLLCTAFMLSPKFINLRKHKP